MLNLYCIQKVCISKLYGSINYCHLLRGSLAEIKKFQSSGKTDRQPGFTQNPLVGVGKPPSSGGFQNLTPHQMGKSGSLKRSGSYSMSQSVRF